MPYTPTPLVNFQYEPEKSDIRRLLDSQQKMKKEKQADQSFDMEMKQAQQAYDMGVLKIKEAQMKTDKIMRDKQLDDESSKVFQSTMMSGGTEADAYRAVKAYRTQNGGWAQRQADQEAEHETLVKALSMAKLSPALADKAANLINSSLDPNGPQMTGQQLYEMQQRKEPIKLNEQGDVMFFEFDAATGQYKPSVKRFQSKEQADEAKQEQVQKKAEFDMKMAESQSRISENQQQIAESKARVALAGQKKKDDMTYEEKQTFMALNKTVSQLDADVRRIQFYKARPAKQSDTLAMLSMLTGQVQASTGNPEADKQIVEDLINARLAEYSQALDELEQLPEGKRIAQSKRRILEAAAKTPVAKPVVDPEGKPVKDPAKVVKPNLFKGFIGSFQ
jgi:hypothetical protein